jgi:hypothetical protein
MKYLLALLLFATPSFAATWYVNAAGGTRYDATDVPLGLCDGTTAAAPVGTIPNQHCAFNDVRFLWADGTYNTNPTAGAPKWGWVGAGGDTYIIDSCIQYSAPKVPTPGTSGSCRIGYSGQTGTSADYYLAIAGDNGSSGAPPPPAGTSGAHTTIIGAAFVGCGMSCPSGTTKTLINGGYGAGAVFSMSGAQYVDVIGLDIDDHAQCGLAGVANGCDRGSPVFDDYAANGISSNTGTSNVTLTDVNIHGLGEDGWHGPIGGNVTFNRVYVGFNTNGGVDLDNGSGIGSTGGMFTINNSTVEWNGCIEEYPIVDLIPAFQCFDQSSGGYGDAIGTPTNDGASFTIYKSIVRYNTQDAIDLLHSFGGTITVSQTKVYGNEGQLIKLGATSSSIVHSNYFVGNCYRLTAGFDFPGAPVGFNAHLGGGYTCRAGGDMIAISWGGASNVMEFDNNTVIAGGATLLDITCSIVDCTLGKKTLRNNLFIGYAVAEYNTAQKPGTFCYSDCNGSGHVSNNSMWTARSNNIFYNFRACPTLSTNEVCTNPVITTQIQTTTPVANVDFNFSAFNPVLPTGSPSIHAGIYNPDVTTDFAGNPFANPPSLGALEYQPPATPSAIFNGAVILGGNLVIQ